jgi:hypothetical protein
MSTALANPFDIDGPITDIDIPHTEWLIKKIIHLAKLPVHVGFALGIEIETDRKVQYLAVCDNDEIAEALCILKPYAYDHTSFRMEITGRLSAAAWTVLQCTRRLFGFLLTEREYRTHSRKYDAAFLQKRHDDALAAFDQEYPGEVRP